MNIEPLKFVVLLLYMEVGKHLLFPVDLWVMDLGTDQRFTACARYRFICMSWVSLLGFWVLFKIVRSVLSCSNLLLMDIPVMRWQENYINYKPSSIGKDDNGLKRMNSISHAAESIADGDIFNVQIRRYQQWQLSQSSILSSCIIPWVIFISIHGWFVI